MILVALLMLKNEKQQSIVLGKTSILVTKNASSIKLAASLKFSDICVKKIIPIALAVGFASGYFGIGGGFLIVPGLLFSTGMCIVKAIGTSLIAVGTFGITSVAEYSFYGYVLPIISITYLAGGIVGGYVGSSIVSKIPREVLRKIFAIIIITVAIYIMYVNIHGLLFFIH